MSAEHVLNPVQVRYSDDRNLIYVTLNPREVLNGQLEAEQVLEALLDHGFSSFAYQIDQQVLEELTHLPWQRLNRVVVRRIAWRVEFDLKVRLSDDQTQAFVTVRPSFAQEVIGRERLLERLAEVGVCQGLDEAALAQILAQGEASDLRVAQAQWPQHGQAGWFEWLFSPLSEGETVQVEPGTPLVRIHPGQPGTDGFSLGGEVLKARRGQDQRLELGPGCVYDAEDPAVIRATISGVPLRGTQRIAVDPLVQYTAGELCSGQYLHSLEVWGDLAADMRIETLGHLLIRGSVSGGFFTAGGEILVTGPVQGPVSLRATGDITLSSAQEALIHTGGDLRVKQFLRHVRAYCCGQLRAEQAALAGGAYYLLQGGVCAELGAAENMDTQLSLGPSAYFQNHWRGLQADQAAFKSRLQALMRRLIQSRAADRAGLIQQQNWLKGEQWFKQQEASVLTQALSENLSARLMLLKQVHEACTGLCENTQHVLAAMQGPLTLSLTAQGYVQQVEPAGTDKLPVDHTE